MIQGQENPELPDLQVINTLDTKADTLRGSQERRDALASMRNIEDELATHAPGL